MVLNNICTIIIHNHQHHYLFNSNNKDNNNNGKSSISNSSLIIIMSSRKDDPVFNVKFVQLVENKPCLWNSTMPEYSKKDAIQKAWQDVANETKDTVRSCRERWRTIRSSFLRSLKLSRTNTGRGKRKYYLSKYLQFLIPYTKTRLKNSANIIAQRKAAAQGSLTSQEQPMTRISNMPVPMVSSDDTKDSTNSTEVAAIAEDDVVVNLHEDAVPPSLPNNLSLAQLMPLISPQAFQTRLPLVTTTVSPTTQTTTIKQEQDMQVGANGSGVGAGITRISNPLSILSNTCQTTTTTTADLKHRYICLTAGGGDFTGSGLGGILNLSTQPINSLNAGNNILNNSASYSLNEHQQHQQQQQQQQQQHLHSANMIGPQAVDLSEFAEWIKCKQENQRHWLMQGNGNNNATAASAAILSHTMQQHNSNINNSSNNMNNMNNQMTGTSGNNMQQQQQLQQQSPPDADQSFLDSLHPFIKEMTGKQNRRFRQKVVALIDAILDDDKDTK